jgi:cytochrome c oxidase assembly factor 4
MRKEPKQNHADASDEVDEYEERIRKTGCYNENEALQLCFYKHKDWRKCKEEMDKFKACYAAQNSDNRSDN